MKRVDINLSLSYTTPALFGADTYDWATFTLPNDLATGSTAYIFLQDWSVEWAPDPNANAVAAGFFLSGLPGANVYSPSWGFQIPATNPSTVPNPIPAQAAARKEYSQIPQFITMNNVVPGQTVYANVTLPYAGDSVLNITADFPYILYTPA